jgi:hypothetical protein
MKEKAMIESVDRPFQPSRRHVLGTVGAAAALAITGGSGATAGTETAQAPNRHPRCFWPNKDGVWFARKDEISRHAMINRAVTPIVERDSPTVSGLPGPMA